MKQLTDTTWQSDNGLITFIQGDCMEFMAGCKENEFQLAVTDPEYGISINHNIGRRKGQKASKHKKVTWDSKPPEDIYFETIKKVSLNQIIWGGNYFPYLWEFGCKGFIIWDKLFSDDVSFSACELAWTSFDKTSKVFRYTPQSDTDKIHPTQKSVKLYRWIFKNYAKPTDHILDTHGGSFSSAIAAHMEGLRMTIIELDPEYFHKAITRFATYEAQQTIKFD